MARLKKGSKKKRIKPIEPRYSGDRSLGFWRKVNSIPTRIENREAYALGVALQEAESAILRQINASIREGNHRLKERRLKKK